MANSRVTRGRQTEQAVADYLKEHGWLNAERRPAALPGTDITGVAGVALEVKARRLFEPSSWIKQAQKNAGDSLPAVVMRPDGMGPATVSSWPVFLRLEDFAALLKAAGYQ